MMPHEYYCKDPTCPIAYLLGAPPVIAPEEIRHRDDNTMENTLFLQCQTMVSCRSRSALRINKARVDERENVYSIISISLFLSIGRSHMHAYAHMHTLHYVRTHVCAPRCTPEDCLLSADSQMIVSDRALLGASDDQQSASRSNQSVADSSAETVIRWFW